MKRVFGVVLAALALSACDNKSDTAHMPEFYVYKTQPICMAEVVTSEPDAEARRKDMFALLPSLLRKTQGWRERFTVVGVDYVDFKKFTMVIKGGCDDPVAVAAAQKDVTDEGRRYTITMGGNADLIGDADDLQATPSPVARFAAINPDAELGDCLIRFSLPRAAEDGQEQIPSAIVAGAMEYHFPVGDVATARGILYMLLAHDCGQRDVVAKNIVEVLRVKGLTEKEVVLDSENGVAEYTELRKG